MKRAKQRTPKFEKFSLGKFLRFAFERINQIEKRERMRNRYLDDKNGVLVFRRPMPFSKQHKAS